MNNSENDSIYSVPSLFSFSHTHFLCFSSWCLPLTIDAQWYAVGKSCNANPGCLVGCLCVQHSIFYYFLFIYFVYVWTWICVKLCDIIVIVFALYNILWCLDFCARHISPNVFLALHSFFLSLSFTCFVIYFHLFSFTDFLSRHCRLYTISVWVSIVWRDYRQNKKKPKNLNKKNHIHTKRMNSKESQDIWNIIFEAIVVKGVQYVITRLITMK